MASYTHILKLMGQEPGGKVDLSLRHEDYHKDVEAIALMPDKDINMLEYSQQDGKGTKPLT